MEEIVELPAIRVGKLSVMLGPSQLARATMRLPTMPLELAWREPALMPRRIELNAAKKVFAH
jgi:hypothetical protein